MALPLPTPPSTADDEEFWKEIRGQFLLDKDAIYLNTGSWGSMAIPVFERLVEEIRELEGTRTKRMLPPIHSVARCRKL